MPSLSRQVLKELRESGEAAAADVLEPLLRAIDVVARLKETKFKRFLSLGDYLIDRWDRANRMGWGEGTSVYDSCLVIGDVSLGQHCWVGPYTVLDGSGGLRIGDHCTLSAGVQIYTHDNIAQTLTGAPIERSPVVLGNRVYLGPNVVVGRGVTIGDGVVVGANSFVNVSLPAGSKAAGNPVRILGGS